jgi:hypothetical protein
LLELIRHALRHDSEIGLDEAAREAMRCAAPAAGPDCRTHLGAVRVLQVAP